MKSLKSTFFLIAAFAAVFSAYSKEIRIAEARVSQSLPIFSPRLIDSLNVENKAWDAKELLKSSVDFKAVLREAETLKADTAGLFSFPSEYAADAVKNKALRLLTFNIDADRYCKAALTIGSNSRFEAWINDKLEKTKDTREDSLDMKKALKLNLTLEPRRYQVVVKFLSEAGNSNVSDFKISIEPDKKDSLAQIEISTSGNRRLTINDILEGSRLTGDCRISPSGDYFIGSTNTVAAGGKSQSVAELRETRTNRVVYRFNSDIYPAWLKTGDRLIYSKSSLSESGRDLYTLALPTLEEKKIAENIPQGSYRVTPDNRFLVMQIREQIPEDKGDLKRVLSPADRSGAYRGRNSIYLYDLTSHYGQRITWGKHNLSVSDIRNDGKKALLAGSEENITERPFRRTTIMELDLNSLKLDTLLTDNFISGGTYSPDGSQALIIGTGEAFGGIGLNIAEGQISNMYDYQAFMLNIATKEVKALTKNFNPSISGADWSDYDGKIYFNVQDKDRVSIYSYEPAKEAFTKLDLPEDMIRGFSIAQKAPVAVYQGEGTNNAYRLYRCDLKTGKSTLLADPFAERLSEIELSKVSGWNFISDDGTTIEGRYYLPFDFDPAKKYPLIVYYYGGTSPTARTFESSYPLQVYAALGYVVYTLQPSGTTGFGQEFAARHVNAWGEKTADEIILGTQLFCRGHEFVDSTKIGCVGASYGGFMTQFLQTRTNIFAAAVSHAGISNITSYWGEGYWGYSYSGAASAFSYPWNNPRLYTEQSPLFSADKINTPLLLLHGTVDTNVPIGESIQMFNALKILGKTVEFVTVKDENHGIAAYQHRIDWNKTIYAWFARWLKNQPEWWNALYPER
ncbi:MAG: S9 family peptidase [Dysgonamonadaceae bacterium]|jgi:dipeptidyl aminopeptidase/acylaminoacyl peptidase|nr:S9 family peptidase [Dysgonamonadaceae bacterium]